MCAIPIAARWGIFVVLSVGNRESREGWLCEGESSRYRDESCASVGAWRCTWWVMSVRVHTSVDSAPLFQSTVVSSRNAESLRRVVPDGVAGPEANPLGDGAVLLLRARKLLLGAE
jgi:hypothetical protein